LLDVPKVELTLPPYEDEYQVVPRLTPASNAVSMAANTSEQLLRASWHSIPGYPFFRPA